MYLRWEKDGVLRDGDAPFHSDTQPTNFMSLHYQNQSLKSTYKRERKGERERERERERETHRKKGLSQENCGTKAVAQGRPPPH